MNTQVTNSILKVNNPSKQEFFELWQQFQPFVIEGVVETWNATHNWSNDYLLTQCGSNNIAIEYHPQDKFVDYNYVTEDYYHTKKMAFSSYIEMIERKQKKDALEYYLGEIDFEENFPELVKDINYPQYFQRKPLLSFWFGFSQEISASVSHLHFDVVHNLFAQIRGRKKFLLYDPVNYLSFYPPLGEKSTHTNHSKVNPLQPNRQLFPNFPWQEGKEVILNPGDLLYLPPFWWHYVTAIDENISLSFWYDVKLKDLIKQQKLFSTYLNIAPAFILDLIHFYHLARWVKSKLSSPQSAQL